MAVIAPTSHPFCPFLLPATRPPIKIESPAVHTKAVVSLISGIAESFKIIALIKLVTRIKIKVTSTPALALLNNDTTIPPFLIVRVYDLSHTDMSAN